MALIYASMLLHKFQLNRFDLFEHLFYLGSVATFWWCGEMWEFFVTLIKPTLYNRRRPQLFDGLKIAYIEGPNRIVRRFGDQ